MTLRVGVDARPLHFPNSGIGRYTEAILENFPANSDLELFLYSHQKLPDRWRDVKQRTAGFAGLPNSVIAQTYFSSWIKKDRLDVFWSPRHHLPSLLSCPAVVTIHDLVWLKQPQTMHSGGRLIERALMPPSIKRAKRIICVSESTRADLVEAFPSATSKCVVVHEAACTRPLPTDNYAEPSRPFFLFVGTKEPRKNLDRCLSAWQISGLAGEGFKLVLAGGQGWKYDLKTSIERSGTATSVIDCYPDESELRKLYSTCYAVILPSMYEGFGLPLVEAMAFGKPILTSNVSSMPEIAGDAGLYFSPDSIQSISEALRVLARDIELHAVLSQNATNRTSLFSWEHAAKATLEVLHQAVG